MTRVALPLDLFSRPYIDLDDVQARIGQAVAFAETRTTNRVVPGSLTIELDFARATLADLAAIKAPKARAKAFRAEHGIETMKGLWFAFADHAASLGLQVAAAEHAL